jgi:hypothetical protein
MGVSFFTVAANQWCVAALVLGHFRAKRHKIQCQTTRNLPISTKQIWPTHFDTKYVRRMRVPLRRNHFFATTCVPAAVSLTSRKATHLHFSPAAHVCVQILQTRLLHRCLAPSHSPNALLPSFPLRSSTIPHRLLCSHPSPLRLIESLPIISLRACAVGSFKALKTTIVRAVTLHFAARVCGQRVSATRHSQRLLHPDPSKAAKRYTRNAFTASTANSRNPIKSHEIIHFSSPRLPASASPAAKHAWT